MRGRTSAWWCVGLGAYSLLAYAGILAHVLQTSSDLALFLGAIVPLTIVASIVMAVVALVRGRGSVAWIVAVGLALTLVAVGEYVLLARAMAHATA